MSLITCLLVVALHKHALLIGINDYSASHITQKAPPVPDRDWPNLRGSLNDVESIREMLIALHGFDPREIVTLTDQAATRDAILRETGRLVASAAKDDVVFFFYAGHGSQVRNSASDEADRLDESIVPADSRRGAPDVRDKELRRFFNRILDRGARLTVMLDDCHSGSGARGLPADAVRRGVKPDLRDVADRSDAGPRPEDRGALVVTASQDFQDARETASPDHRIRGAFTWAWMCAMRDASPNEPAADTFLRACARLHTETPFQEPVLAATPSTRRTPFLGTGTFNRRPSIAVIRVRGNIALLQGGWAHGLAKGSTLRAPNGGRVVITELLGLGQSEARIECRTGSPACPPVTPGMPLEQTTWMMSSTRPLRLHVPRIHTNAISIEGLGHLLAIVAKRRQLHWINDPTSTTPSFVIRHADRGWQLLANSAVRQFTDDDAGAEDALAAIPRGAAVFVQFPAPFSFDIASNASAADADYILAGRYVRGKLTYAWVRPGVTREDRCKSGLPLRTSWVGESSPLLRDAVPKLRRILAWQLLEAPAAPRWPYHLALRRDAGDALVSGAMLSGASRYRAVLRGDNLPSQLSARYLYLFIIDSHGQSTLLFPDSTSGSVENHLPLDESPPPAEIPLTTFEVTKPYGVDTYVLLSSEQPLPDPSILEWDGVRTISAPSFWSIERMTFESAPRTRRKGV